MACDSDESCSWVSCNVLNYISAFIKSSLQSVRGSSFSRTRTISGQIIHRVYQIFFCVLPLHWTFNAESLFIKSILKPACCGFVAIFTLKYLFNQTCLSCLNCLQRFLRRLFLFCREFQAMLHAWLYYQIQLWFFWKLRLRFLSHTGKNLQPQYKFHYNGWYCANDKSFLSDSQIKEVENDGQKQEVMNFKFMLCWQYVRFAECQFYCCVFATYF